MDFCFPNTAQCPLLTPTNPDFGLTISYDSADGVPRQFTTATYSDCDGENSLVNFGNSGSRSRVCNFDPVTPRLFWSGEEPTCRGTMLYPYIAIIYESIILSSAVCGRRFGRTIPQLDHNLHYSTFTRTP